MGIRASREWQAALQSQHEGVVSGGQESGANRVPVARLAAYVGVVGGHERGEPSGANGAWGVENLQHGDPLRAPRERPLGRGCEPGKAGMTDF